MNRENEQSRECEQKQKYDRERQALYLTGLLPLHDYQECKATLALCERLLPMVSGEARTD